MRPRGNNTACWKGAQMSVFSLYLAHFSPICVSTYSWSPSPTCTPTQSPKPQRNWEQVYEI